MGLVCYLLFSISIETLPLLSVQLSQHLLEMLSSVQTFVTALMQQRPDAWTRVQAVGCIKAAVTRVEAARLQDVLMGSVLEMTALGVLMLIDFFFSFSSLPPL